MDRYIGIDAHATSCTVVVIGPSGRKLSEQVIETKATELVECIQSVPRPEHGTHSGTHSADTGRTPRRSPWPSG